jgi:hypothetical protein
MFADVRRAYEISRCKMHGLSEARACKTTMKRQNRIQFTEKELDNLIGLICIADANGTEGDYAEMTDADWTAINTAAIKIAELLRRKGKGSDKTNSSDKS